METVIWGAGNNLETVLKYINDDIKIRYIVDNDKEKQGTNILGFYEIISPTQLLELDFELIIVSVKNYESIQRAIEAMGLGSKTVYFWKDYANENCHVNIFKNRIEELYKEMQLYKARLNSAPYEWGIKETPKIKSSESLLKKMINDGSSLCRYGDGEFEIMLARNSAWFQEKEPKLAERLRKIIKTNISGINIAIAQNFKYLDQYKEKAADDMRIYMEGDVRTAIMSLLSADVTYYDAYVSRPYYIYKDSKNADIIFPLFKKLWEGRNVCIVEGEYGRFGIGNDLLESAHSISRIACPSKNAWERYESIKSYIVRNIRKDILLLISLGPAATVLAYELALDGYQAVDIGQLDNEYDWYMSGAVDRTAVEGKLVAEVSQKWEAKISIEKVYIQQLLVKII